MTLHEAKQALATPLLTFGDARQIDAMRLVEKSREVLIQGDGRIKEQDLAGWTAEDMDEAKYVFFYGSAA